MIVAMPRASVGISVAFFHRMGKRAPPPRAEETRSDRSTDALIIPVVAEEARVRRQTSERARVRITKTVEREHGTLLGRALSRTVHVERVPVDRFVEEPASVRREGDTLIVPVHEEVPTVVLRTKLKEGLRITTRTSGDIRRLPVTTRRERVTVEHVGAGAGHDHPQERRRRR